MSGECPRFASVVLDVDSTLTRVEGIEWLGARRGGEVSREIDDMTRRAMEGDVPLDAVYGTRLALVCPGRDDVAALTDAYIGGTMPEAADTIARLHAAGVRVVLVSGGVRDAVVPFAETLGVDSRDVYAVSLAFTSTGQYAGFDTSSPLSRRGGKPSVVKGLGLPRPLLAVGDGSTDAELAPKAAGNAAAADAFAAFVGVAARASVVAVADYVVHRLADLEGIVRGAGVT